MDKIFTLTATMDFWPNVVRSAVFAGYLGYAAKIPPKTLVVASLVAVVADGLATAAIALYATRK